MGLAHQVSHMFRGKNIYIYIQLQTHVSLVNPDLVAITETWLHNGVSDGEIFPDSYIVHRRDRESRGGGVLLAIKSSSLCFRRCDLETECEILWCEIPVRGSTSYFFGVFYRPPNSDIKYLEELYKSLEKVHLLSERVKIILTGDFNFPDIDWNLTAPLQPNSLSDYFCDTIMNYFRVTLESLKDYKKEDLERFSRIIILVMNNY